MYEKHYGLSALPFQLTPDSRFYFESQAHARAVAHLTFGLAQGEGFVVVTGEVGAGKTMLIEHLFGQLSRETHAVARINTTQVSGEDLFRLAMAGFDLAPDADAYAHTHAHTGKAGLLGRFKALLDEHRQAGRRCLLIVDEVQNLSRPALEELRMLSNITEGGRTALQTILLGQPQFRRMLASPDLDQLRQRVLASYHLGPLTRDETRGYILHRLGTVGWAGRPGWEDAAFAAVFDHCGGIPRRINRLCARVLLFGALERAEAITGAMVAATAEELAQDLEAGRGPMPPLHGDRMPQNGSGQHGDRRDNDRRDNDRRDNDRRDNDRRDNDRHETDRRDSAELAELRRRLDGLERRVGHREQVLQRLLDVLALPR